MLLDVEIKQQLEQYLALLENDIVIKVSAGNDSVSTDMLVLIDELTKLSSKIHVEKVELDRTPSFSINRLNEDTGIVFAGVPLGHEFTSLVLALLQVGGRAPKVEDTYIDQIKQLKGEYHFETYISLTCHNCPDVVQALNIMSVLNPNVTHTMIDGAAFKEEVESKDIMAVPTIYLNGNFFESGRLTLEEILAKLGQVSDVSSINEKEPFDVLVIGGGPAGVSSAIYTARKGLHTGIVAERFGGQVLDTLGIENFISVPYTEGPKLAENLKEHVKRYNVDTINVQKASSIRRKELLEVELESGAVLKSKTVIIATGARWRNVNVPGEKEFKTKGVAYCPHCDGPLFVGKDVAEILAYKEPHKAIARHVDEDDRIKHPIIDSLGRMQEALLINESGLYALIISSKLPKAKAFKRWITSEVGISPPVISGMISTSPGSVCGGPTTATSIIP